MNAGLEGDKIALPSRSSSSTSRTNEVEIVWLELHNMECYGYFAHTRGCVLGQQPPPDPHEVYPTSQLSRCKETGN